MLVHWILSWIVAALALWIVAKIMPGIEISGFGDAVLATLVLAVLNVTLKPILSFFAFPLTLLTLGLFMLVINAMVLIVASMLVPGFRVRGFLNAVVGSLLLTVLTLVLNHLV
jgi:putative membrane protein